MTCACKKVLKRCLFDRELSSFTFWKEKQIESSIEIAKREVTNDITSGY